MDERAAKRKREDAGDAQTPDNEDTINGRKKQRLDDDPPRTEEMKSLAGNTSNKSTKRSKDDATIAAEKAAKRKEKRAKTKEKQASRQAEVKARKDKNKPSVVEPSNDSLTIEEDFVEETFPEKFENIENGDLGHINGSGSSTASPSPSSRSPFDPLHDASGSSSISSIAPPISTDENAASNPSEQKPSLEAVDQQELPDLPTIDPQILKDRFHQRLEELRAARKADGTDGKGPRSRQDLIEARRKKEEQRKAHKKQLRQKAKEEEKRKQADLIARGSPLMSPSLQSPGSPLPNNFSYGRIAFPNGQQSSADLSLLHNARKPKGPQDPRTALQAAQNKEKRIAGFDKAKRDDIAEKDVWLNSLKRAQGERIRDDSSLLKKTLKRKEKQKKKSEEKWDERLEGVRKGQEMRQKKRENNLAKRKEEKGKGGKKDGKGKPKKARPGFEGSFRARTR